MPPPNVSLRHTTQNSRVNKLIQNQGNNEILVIFKETYYITFLQCLYSSFPAHTHTHVPMHTHTHTHTHTITSYSVFLVTFNSHTDTHTHTNKTH